MPALVIIANPASTSFSHAMAAVAQRTLLRHGYEVICHDWDYVHSRNPWR